MARIIGEHFRRDGRPKRAFASKPEAWAWAIKRKQHAYYCRFCQHWHVARNQNGRTQ